MAKGPEGRIKDDVKKYLDSIGAYYFMPVQTGYGKPTLDFLACWQGIFIGIETKAPGRDRPTARQKQTILEICKAGGIAATVTDADHIDSLLSRAEEIQREFLTSVA